jgi:hypothetical protein
MPRRNSNDVAGAVANLEVLEQRRSTGGCSPKRCRRRPRSIDRNRPDAIRG